MTHEEIFNFDFVERNEKQPENVNMQDQKRFTQRVFKKIYKQEWLTRL